MHCNSGLTQRCRAADRFQSVSHLVLGRKERQNKKVFFDYQSHVIRYMKNLAHKLAKICKNKHTLFLVVPIRVHENIVLHETGL